MKATTLYIQPYFVYPCAYCSETFNTKRGIVGHILDCHSGQDLKIVIEKPKHKKFKP